MAITFARECKFPQNLEVAYQDLLQDAGDRIAENQVLLNDAIAAQEGIGDLIDEGNQILNEILKKSDGTSAINNLDDISTYFGLPKDEPTSLEDEKYLALAGIIVKNKVLYLSGAKSPTPGDLTNIKNLRRLYFAVGRNLDKVEELLATKNKTFFVYSKLTIRTIPPKQPNRQAFSLDEIKAFLRRDEITSEDIVVLEDYSTLVALKDYLNVDITLAEVKRRYNLQDHEVIVDVFHFGSVDNSAPAIARYERNSFTSTKLASILNGTDLIENANTNVIPDDIDEIKTKANVIIQEISFVIGRLQRRLFSPSLLQSFRSKTQLSIEALEIDHQQAIADTHFKVTIILQKDTLEKLRVRHSDTQIKEMLEQRSDIEGIYFDPPDDLLFKELEKAMAASPPGSTTISNRFLNNKVYPPISMTVLMQMMGDLRNAYTYMSEAEQTINTLGKTNSNLINYTGRNPAIQEQLEANPNGISANPATTAIANVGSTDPVTGQPIATTSTAVDPLTGQPTTTIDPVTGQPTTTVVDPTTGQVVSTRQVAAANAAVDPTPVEPGVASPIDTSGNATDNTGGLAYFQGQPSYSTPASLLTWHFDASLTMNLTSRVEELSYDSNETKLKSIYPDSIAKPLAQIINLIAKFFEIYMKLINMVMDLFEKGISFLKKKLDAFLSKFTGLIGKGSFENSLFACAINLNLSLSTSLLDNLLVLINNLMARLAEFISKILLWVTNLLEKILCMPINLINSLVSSFNTALGLPNLCQSKIALNPELEQALRNLRAVGDIKTVQMKAFIKDLIRAKLDITGASDQLGQFNNGSVCNSHSMGNFINSAALNIGAGAGFSIGF